MHSSKGSMLRVKFRRKCVGILIAAALTSSSHAQTPATLTDIGAAAPTPGPLDIVQLSTSGDTTFPDGLNYYTDNQTDHGAGEPGQTFTTAGSTNGFTLTSLALKSAGLDSGGGSPGDNINYLLHIYSVSGNDVTLVASYITASPISYTEGDWLRWTGLSAALSGSTAYAYSFGKAASGDGWDAVGVAGGNPYPGGQIALIPPGGGAMTFGSNDNYDATFDLGLVAGAPPAPVVTNGSYIITCPSGGGYALDDPNGDATEVNQVTYADQAQQWVITLEKSNEFEIANVVSGLALTGTNIESQLALQPYAGTSNQLWTFTADGEYWNIYNVGFGDNMDDWGGGFGQIVGEWDPSASNQNQQWTLTPVPVVPPGSPVVTNLPAGGVQANAAVLNGQIISSAGSLPDVTIYYGTTDGGTNAANWQYAVGIGSQLAMFSLTVPDLSANTTYFYTAFAVNNAGGAWAAPSQSFTTPASNPAPTLTSVLTYHDDNTRDGANTNETGLTPSNVNVNSFGRLFSYPVEGYVYAEPLVVTNVNIPGKGVHDVVYVATEHDMVYAFDADGNQGTDGGLLWSTNLGVSALSSSGAFGTRYHNGQYIDLVPEVGITGTPVIDPASGTMYLDAFTLDGTNNGVAIYNHRIHALDITTGVERPYSPVVVAASVPGTGVAGSNGVVVFNPEQQLQRPGLTLAGGMVYVGYGSYADTDPYHGWVLGFHATNLQLVSSDVFNTTPNATVAAFGANAGEGALWMGGDGLCVDAETNLYYETANGSFSENTNGDDYGDSFMKLSTTNGLKVADYFTPYNQAALQAGDVDLGSGGPVLLPDDVGSATHPHLIVGAGKEGTIHLVDRDNMGGYNPANDSQIVQELPGAIGANFGAPAYFNHLIFYQGISDVMKAFSISNAVIASTPASASAVTFGFPGATPAISANGAADAIAWAIQADAYGSSGPAVLHAYNATNLSQELYNSSQDLARDNPGGAVKMTVPTIAGGKVYVGAEGELSVFGTGIFLSAPAIEPDGGIFGGSVTVTLSAPPGVSLYYTLDGTTPTTNAVPYIRPFALTNSAVVAAIAAAPGAVNSGAASASFDVLPPVFFTSEGFLANGQFQLGFEGVVSDTYILEATTNFLDWVPLDTNLSSTSLFDLFDPNATNFPYRFYRVLQQ
ncbi:MAG TPA: RICIN domain-containing protein [Verrucomicrobiae bacterium]|nr:RICIN domain-containing protein [Verrucomicrobiae bacterium]